MHRADQVSSSTWGLAKHFVSPCKSRDKRKTQTFVNIPGADVKHRQLALHMQALIDPTSPDATVAAVLDSSSSNADVTMDILNDDNEWVYESDHNTPEPHLPSLSQCDISIEPQRRTLPDKASRKLYGTWTETIPTLIGPLLMYLARTVGQPLKKLDSIISACTTHSCTQKHTMIPRIAVSLELLSFHRALFECSCDTVNALAAALKTHYAQRGFQLTDSHGNIIQEPFRRSLGSAVQWYDILQIEMERKIEAAILQARYQMHASYEPLLPSHEPSMPSHEPSTPSHKPLMTSDEPLTTSCEPLMPSREPQASTLHKGHCASILVDRCPACFAGMATFITITSAQLVTALVSMNRHTFYQRCMLINIIPNEAIDQCESSYEAADGKKQKAAMDSFDDTGLMALICHHDIPLFFTNIDTPGEQQKYAVALLEHLFLLLPTNTTVIALYDVGCVLSRSLSQYDILDTSITSQLRFATTAMHAYGHEWGCQLVYNPHMCRGLGLSDGEGTEWLWS
ncbi:uncharacterized protein F5891DRAFT_1187233 [Suillus fuscotomentosus]|uniref:Uncharacterized protein n=1 Tax=Suillus fuscotomentosus TaxID=1912939 RepID=A0AAD4HMK8_9AGAM|nr:uncharacterized protein F5891DRAFT_1187233 [Suillus fuscotomentosus]KAG1901766.1 hypothetical protein F5891DRAFT_1187233 [Suillus fuscotomentosus]